MSVTTSEIPVSTRGTRPENAPINPVALMGLALCIFAFWMIEHPYEGIVHDSILYAFSALARLHPDSLGHDVYLTLGVQDRYTVFSPIAASAIRLFGLGRAASLITLIAQLAFFGCGWLLARRLMPPMQALLSVALLVMLPAIYGDAHIFSYAEAFMTARLPSEVFVVGTLIAALSGRYVLAALCLAAGALLHPIMAAAGVMMLFMLYVGLPRPKLAAAIALSVFAVLVAIAWLAPFGPVGRFDTGWFDLLYFRGAYLFPSLWPLLDWAHASVPLTVLAVGAITSTRPQIRSLCIAALATGLSGLAISLIGSDLLHIVLVAQVQPWRWLWLSNALAVILTPVILKNCWTAGGANRSSAVLLAAAWVCVDEPYVPIIDFFAILVAATARYVTDSRRARLMLVGAYAILVLGLMALAGFVLGVVRQLSHIPPDTILYDSPYLFELRRWRPWQAGGIVPACIFLGAWWTTVRRKDLVSTFAVLALGAALCAAFGQFAWNAWTRVDGPDRLYAEFAPWRQVIPKQAQVFWTDSAFPTWYLLERPSYWSRSQMAASVFSENMARELSRREWVILAIEASTRDPRQILIRTCRNNPSLGYYVAAVGMGPTPFPQIKNPHGDDVLRLYRCADHRK